MIQSQVKYNIKLNSSRLSRERYEWFQTTAVKSM